MSGNEATLGSAYNDGPPGFWRDERGALFVGPFPADDHWHYASIDEDLIWTWSRSAAGTPADNPLHRVDFLAAVRWIMDQARTLRARIAAAEERLADYQGSAARIMGEKCPSDEKHCTCVPALKTALAAARRESAEAFALEMCRIEFWPIHLQPAVSPILKDVVARAVDVALWGGGKGGQ